MSGGDTVVKPGDGPRSDSCRETVRALIDALSEAVLFVEPDGTLVEVNQAACRSVGYTRGEMVGQHISIIARSRDGLLASRMRVLAEGASHTFESTHRRKDGTEFPVEVTPRPVVLGDRKYLMAVVRDLSGARDEAEQEAERQATLIRTAKMATIATLAAGVAHEINNPLAIISGYMGQIQRLVAELAPGGVVPPAIGRLIRQQEEALRRIAAVTKGLGDFASAGPATVVVDVHEVIESVAIMLRPMFETAGIAIAMTLRATRSHVRVDVADLRQVFVDLLINARDAIEAKGAGRGLVAIETADRQDTIEILIRDDGVGISEEAMPRVFDPFFSTKSRGAGVGLGLFSAHSALTRMGGIITLSSRLGAETTAHIGLPVTTEPAVSATATRSRDVASDRSGGTPLRVLVVDDEPDIRALVARIVEAAGARSIVASSGVEALRIAESNEIDAVVADIRMPGMDGRDLVRQLSRKLPATTRYVFMTGLVDGTIEGIEAAMDGIPIAGVLRKPFPTRELLGMLRLGDRSGR